MNRSVGRPFSFGIFVSEIIRACSDLRLLIELGNKLDHSVNGTGTTIRDWLIEKLLRVRRKDGRIAPLILNRTQRDFSSRCGRRNIVLKARQLGMSTYIAARFFIGTITRPGTLTVQVAHDQRSAEEIFRIVHRFLSHLPEAVRKGALSTSRANVRQLVFPQLDSEYRVETAADPNAGRGLTIQNLHCSEVARWPGDQAETLASLRAAVPPDGETVLESTPNGASGVFYEEWMRAEENGCVRHFFPWWWEPAYKREHVEVGELNEEEQALVLSHGLTPAQIAFRREIQRNFRGLAQQEFAEDAVTCFMSSGECVFDVQTIETRLAEAPDAIELHDNGRERMYWPPRVGGQYIVGADPAGGGANGDYSSAVVIDRMSGLECAELHGHFPPQVFASRLAKLARRFNNALLAVERNNHGHAVLAFLQTAEHYGHIYELGGQAGFPTNVATRPRIVDRLAAVLSCSPWLFSSRGLLEECRTFIRRADGSAAAAAGAHDDRVMAMAIALEVREQLVGRSNTASQAGFAMAGGR